MHKYKCVDLNSGEARVWLILFCPDNQLNSSATQECSYRPVTWHVCSNWHLCKTINIKTSGAYSHRNFTQNNIQSKLVSTQALRYCVLSLNK